MSNEKVLRDLFEAWAIQQHDIHNLPYFVFAKNADGSYMDSGAQHAWLGWSGAVASRGDAVSGAVAIPADCDVRKIPLRVVPGDGSGLEVYVKNTKDVEDLLCEMGVKLEDYELAARPAPVGVSPVGASREAFHAAMRVKGFNVNRSLEGTSYVSRDTGMAWEGYQVATQPIVPVAAVTDATETLTSLSPNNSLPYPFWVGRTDFGIRTTSNPVVAKAWKEVGYDVRFIEGPSS